MVHTVFQGTFAEFVERLHLLPIEQHQWVRLETKDEVPPVTVRELTPADFVYEGGIAMLPERPLRFPITDALIARIGEEEGI